MGHPGTSGTTEDASRCNLEAGTHGFADQNVQRVFLDVGKNDLLQGQHAHLRAIAMRDDGFMRFAKRGEGVGGNLGILALVITVISSPRLRSALPPSATTTRPMDQAPNVATRIALMVCIRFSNSRVARLELLNLLSQIDRIDSGESWKLLGIGIEVLIVC